MQFLHPKRGREAIEDIGIIPRYNGVIVHDRYSSYFSYTHLIHALCIAHLLRDLNFVEESTQNKWASRLKRLLKAAISMVDGKKEKVLSDEEYKKLQRLYGKILLDALSELPVFPPSKGVGRTKLTAAQNLWEAFLKHEDSILLFARLPEVDATNNRAERDLRMNKVKQKVAGCFRTFKSAVYFCRNRSFIMTMRNLGFSCMKAITLGQQGKFPMYRENSRGFTGLRGTSVLSAATIDRNLRKEPTPKAGSLMVPINTQQSFMASPQHRV